MDFICITSKKTLRNKFKLKTDKQFIYIRFNKKHCGVISIRLFFLHQRSMAIKKHHSYLIDNALINFQSWQNGFTSFYDHHLFTTYWHELNQFADFFVIDHTNHTSACDGVFIQFPITNSKEYTLKCYSCNADIDLEWLPDRNLNGFRSYLIWKKLWEPNCGHSYVEWIPEEVLEDILKK